MIKRRANMIGLLQLILCVVCLLIAGGNVSAQPCLPACYHTRAEVDSFVYALERDDSTRNIVYIDSIGHSRGQMLGEVYPIYAVKISDNADVFEDEPTVLIICHIHAEEVLGLETCLEYMYRLTHQYGRYRELVNNTQLYFIPTMNPDGLEVISRCLDRTWRKNGYHPPEMAGRECTVVPGVGEDSCGTDLNRNFDSNWIWGDSLWYRTAFEPFDYYRGPAPFSEPETQAVRDFSERIKPTVSIVYHSSRRGGVAEQGIVAWQWGEDPGPYKFPPDSAAIAILNHAFCALLEHSQGGTYQPVWGGTHNGCLQDWFYGNLGCVQILAEIGPPGMIQPDSCPILAQMIEDFLVSLNWMCRRGVNLGNEGPTPLAIYTRDAVSGFPIWAEWRIVNTWTPVLAPWYTSPEFGRATFLPPPGEITIHARREGYLPATVTTVVNPSGFQQDIVLELQPLPWYQLSVSMQTSWGSPLSGRVHIGGDFPRWEDVPATGRLLALPEGSYRLLLVSNDPGFVALWRNVIFTADLAYIVTMPSGDIVYSEDFESGLNWTSGGTNPHWRLDPDTTAHHFGVSLCTNPSGYRAVYPPNSDTWITLNAVINVAGGNVAHLEFDRRGRMDVPADSFFVEVSLDLQNWEVAAGFCDRELPWTRTYVDLGPWTPSYFGLRFRMKTDAGLGELGMWVDNLKIYAGEDLATPERPMATPYTYRITGAYPNPFNPSTTITYEVALPGTVVMAIFNVLGESVKEYSVWAETAGPQRLVWNGTSDVGRPVGTGLYFVQLRAANHISTHKLLLLR